MTHRYLLPGKSIGAAIFAAVMVLCNITSMTRVFLTPALRESFAMPMLPWQLVAIVSTLQHQGATAGVRVKAGEVIWGDDACQRQGGTKEDSAAHKDGVGVHCGARRWLLIVATTACFATPWQFAPFPLCCEAIATYIVCILGQITPQDVRTVNVVNYEDTHN